MSSHLTVKQAMEHFGISGTVIRKVYEPIVKDDDHEDRHYILPSAEEAAGIRATGDRPRWRIDSDFLDRVLASAKPKATRNRSQRAKDKDMDAANLITLFESQLNKKDEQIKSLHE